jgi:hypothetical protein
MCRQLEVSRSDYCQWRSRACSERSKANATLDVQVAAIHVASRQSYGRGRIVKHLRRQGVQVGHERVRRRLRRQGLRPVYPRPYRVTTDSNHRKPGAHNLLDRRFDGWQINQAWVADCPCLRCALPYIRSAYVLPKREHLLSYLRQRSGNAGARASSRSA